jgi:glutamate-ammonia-ligase adenylyltransferase
MKDLPPTIFADPRGTVKNLRTIHEMFLSSGSQYSLEQFAEALNEHIVASPDPDMAVTNLLRLAEATVSKASLFNDLVHYPVLMELLMKVVAYSPYFADILVRDPELFRWLTASDSLMKERTKNELGEETHRILKMFATPERRLDGLKRMFRREILRIGSRDIMGNADLATLTRELSVLADTIIDAACRVTEQQLAAKYEIPPPTAYSVIGLGKLGGNELNYSSDVDIIFVYAEEGETPLPAGRPLTNHEYFNKFVERLVQNLTQNSAEGHLYRVDTRLRPEGGIAPLARSVNSYLVYYESRGELWERQMLLKARPVAGDVPFGRKFLKKLEPFVYPRTLFHHPAESIARLKARIEATIGDDENVKLRAGGIRDIEFIVQSLQLVNAGQRAELREGNTLQAVELLARARLISPDERKTLVDSYVFFRTLEHRLQTMLNTQTHTLPSDRRTLQSLAGKLGLASGDELREQQAQRLQSVRMIFESVFPSAGGETEETLSELVESGAGEARMAKVLAANGFRDTRKASRNLAFLITGSSMNEFRGFDIRTRQAFRRIAPQLLAEIAATPSPDMTLHNLTMILSGGTVPESLYNQLTEANSRKLLLSISSFSPRIAREIARDPLLLELLAADPRFLSSSEMHASSLSANPVVCKRTEEIRSAARNLLGLTTYDEMAVELSALADYIIRRTFEAEQKRARLKTTPLAVFALGKLGTRELGFDADLDLLFIAESGSKSSTDKLEKLASSIITQLTGRTADERMYEVDVRLRPEGKNAPLVVERGAYEQYLYNRASLWERQSLTRLRFVCGDKELVDSVQNIVTRFVYETPLPPDWAVQTVAMRKKMESRSRVSGADFHDIKLGAGGMADVEFIAQMIQLKFASQYPELKGIPTKEVLRIGTSLLQWSPLENLSDMHQWYCTILKFMRLTLEVPGSVLPQDEKLDLLAKCMNISSGEALTSEARSTMKHVRAVFLAFSEKM